MSGRKRKTDAKSASDDAKRQKCESSGKDIKHGGDPKHDDDVPAVAVAAAAALAAAGAAVAAVAAALKEEDIPRSGAEALQNAIQSGGASIVGRNGISVSLDTVHRRRPYDPTKIWDKKNTIAAIWRPDKEDVEYIQSGELYNFMTETHDGKLCTFESVKGEVVFEKYLKAIAEVTLPSLVIWIGGDTYLKHPLPELQEFMFSRRENKDDAGVVDWVTYAEAMLDLKKENHRGWTLSRAYHLGLAHGTVFKVSQHDFVMRYVIPELEKGRLQMHIPVEESTEYTPPPTPCSQRPHNNSALSRTSEQDCAHCSARFLCGVDDETDDDDDE